MLGLPAGSITFILKANPTACGTFLTPSHITVRSFGAVVWLHLVLDALTETTLFETQSTNPNANRWDTPKRTAAV